MVDQDRFTRSASPGWSRSARAVRDAAPVQSLGRQLEEDIYADLHKRGGRHNALLRHFEGQEALQKQNPLPALHRAVPETNAVLATGVASGEQLVRLYRLHVDEWRRFPHPMTAAFLPCGEQDGMTA